MNSSEFATLCGISKPMVSKYNADGLISMNGKQVDARASLAALAGRLNEDKRLLALEKLDALEAGIVAEEVAAKPAMPRKNEPGLPAPTSFKARRDQYLALNAEVEYRKKVGELLAASDVAQQAELAVEGMREQFSKDRRSMAQDLCAMFDIPADREAALMRFISDRFEGSIGRFGVLARKMAEPAPETVKLMDMGEDIFTQSDLGF